MFTLIHVIIAIVVFQIIGFIWYGPLFGKVWSSIIGMSMEGKTPAEKKAMNRRMIPTYIINLLSSLVFIFAFGFSLYASLLTSLGLALVVYVGFVLPMFVQNALWSGKTRKQQWQMFSMQAGYQLLAVITLLLLFK